MDHKIDPPPSESQGISNSMTSPIPELGSLPHFEKAPPAPRRFRWLVIGILCSGALLGGILLTARNQTPQGGAVNPKKDGPYLDGTLIRFSEAFEKRIGITTVKVHTKDLAPVVSVTGTVTFDARKFASVGARIPGRVHRVFKLIGDSVVQGEPLAELESADLGRAEALYLGARAKERAAEAEMNREAELTKARVSAQRDAEAAKANYEAARAERVAIERTILAMGGERAGGMGNVILRSPIAGKVVESKVLRGQIVDPTATAYEIADISTVWVMLRVFEHDLTSVHKGDQVDIVFPGAPHPVAGIVDHVGEVVSADTRTASLRVVVENKEGLLRPGQSVHAKIHIQGPVGKELVVPRAAVSRVDGKPMVLLKVDKGAVEPRPITLGPADGNDVTCLQGLKEGDEVILGGLFALKSEIFR